MSDSPLGDEDSLAELVGQIADEFSEELDQGKQPDIESYAHRYPNLAERLREVLPTLRLIRAAAKEVTPTPPHDVAVTANLPLDGRLGDYRLIRELGRGGMGVVYEAEQLSLGRRVALKVLPSLAAFDAKQLQRFKNEAQAAAQLHHANIVSVYAVGCEGDLHFFAMQLVEGQTLAGLISNWRQTQVDGMNGAATSRSKEDYSKRMSPLARFRVAAELGVQAALALEHAHQVGTLHRDIKPANLLIEANNHLWITDFGLARLRGDSDLTLSGDLLGTVRYMSPEQALAKHALVDQRADVYSLGITLYELLTLEPAIVGEERAALIHQVAFDEPRPPCALNRAIPADLETIVLKAIAKNREERYLHAQELADDLRRYLENRPILARRPTPWQRIKKWSQRHKAVVTTAVACSMAALLALVVLETKSRFQLQEKQNETTNALETATAKNLEAEKARGELLLTLVDTFTSTGLTAGERGEVGQAVLWFAHAARAAAQMASGDPIQTGGEPNPRTKPASGDSERVEANRQRVRFWTRQVPLPIMAATFEAGVKEWSFRPTGDQLLVLGVRGAGSILDVRTRMTIPLAKPGQPITAAAWNPDGHSYVLGHSDGNVEVVAFPSGEHIQRFHHAGSISTVAFAPDGHLLAVGGDKVRVWDCRLGRFVTAEFVHPRMVEHLLFNSKGDRLISACTDGLARIFAIAPEASDASVAPLFAPLTNVGNFRKAEKPIKPILVDGDRGLIVCGMDGAVWCDINSGKVLRSLGVGVATDFAVSEDGNHFVVCQSSVAQIWTANPPQPSGPALLHNYSVHASFCADGQSLLTGSIFKIRRWSVTDGKELDPLCLTHQDAISRVLCSPSGEFFATVQDDGMVRMWTLPSPAFDKHFIPIDNVRSFVRASPDRRLVMPPGAGCWPNELRRTRVYEIETGKPVGPFIQVGGVLTDAVLAPDGKSAATVAATSPIMMDRYLPQLPSGPAGRLERWNWHTGEKLGEPIALPADPRNVAYSPDGQRLVVMCGGGQVLLIDSTDGKILERLEHGKVSWSDNLYSSVRFSPDGSMFATSGLIPMVRLWNTVTGKPWGSPLEHGDHCRSVEFSRDGRWLVTASRDKLARVWDLTTGKLAAPALQHTAELFGASFNPDGTLIVTACGDGMARVWDWQTGKLASPAFKHGEAVCAAEFSPDGRTIFVVDRLGRARLWEYHTGKPITPTMPTESSNWFPMTACFSADGRFAVAAGQGTSLAAFNLTELVERDELNEDELVEFAELISGYRLEAGGITSLTMPEWRARWDHMQQAHPGLRAFIPPGTNDWHRRQAQYLEATKNFSGAAWHWRKLLAIEPGQASWHFRLGEAYASLLQWQQALAEFKESLRLEPGNADVLARSARAYNVLGDQKRAAAEFDEAVRQNPRIARRRFECGFAHLVVHEYAQALDEFKAALNLDPTLHVNGLIWLYQARAHLGLEHGAEARHALVKGNACFERDEKMSNGFQPSVAQRAYFQRWRKEVEAELAKAPSK
jgi:eukaryotic-like serine/threonine-protein kinase